MTNPFVRFRGRNLKNLLLNFNTLAREQSALPLQSARKTTKFLVCRQHAVTRD